MLRGHTPVEPVTTLIEDRKKAFEPCPIVHGTRGEYGECTSDSNVLLHGRSQN